MKIAILTNEYPPNVYGGAGVHVEYLTKELLKIDNGKHQVKVICFGNQNINENKLSVKGISNEFKVDTKKKKHKKFLETMINNVITAGILDDVDIVHCHTWYTHFAGLLSKQLLDIPLVLTTHSLEPHRPWKVEQLGKAYNASSWIEKTAYENADGIIAVSSAMKKDVSELYDIEKDKVEVIYNGIDLDQYKPEIDKDILIKYDIDQNKPFLLFVGRITRQKGIVHLVNSIKYINEDVQIVLCAGMPDTKEIEIEMKNAVDLAKKETKNNIIWIPEMLPKEDIIKLYSMATVFVCPSVYEPFGIINLEAMACKTPVIASEVGGIPEIIIHGKTGLMVPIEFSKTDEFSLENPIKFEKDFAKAIDNLLKSPEKIKEMGENSRKRVENIFSWQSIAEKTIRFYEKTIN